MRSRLCRVTPALLLGLALAFSRASSVNAQPVPPHNRVIVVIMENKSYAQVSSQPYTASLMAAGASFTSSFAIGHPSQSNYFALWAGSTLGVTTNTCPAPGTPFTNENLGHACEAAGLKWAAYCENLATAAAGGCSYDGNATSGLYTRKHAPWTNFININHFNERPYPRLAADIAGDSLANLVFVIPNNCHNSHNNTTPLCGVPDADTWLSNNLPPMIAALGSDGVLILTWDEDNDISGNQILTVFVGPRVTPGYVSTQMITHYTVVRTITEMLGLPSFGLAANETPIADIWSGPTAVRSSSWGALKIIYR